MRKITYLFLLISVALSAQIQKVEPAFWWHGMKNPEVQLLLYGKNISTYQLDLSDEVKILDLTKTENPNYVFVTINTDQIKTNSFKINLKKGKKTVDSYAFELKTRMPGSAERSSFSSKDLIYLIMPDRFANGDLSNDSQPYLTEKANRNLPSGRHGGDLRGIIKQLDYLQNLGVTALWLTPVNEDNEKQTSYHGYAQTDLYKIDGRYGSNSEYLELSRELKKRGMLLIQDYVTNHWGISHWMIQDLPTADWIHQFSDGEGQYGFKRSTYRTATQFDPYAAPADRADALNGWFDTTMPDLNQANPLVLKYLTQNAIWWIETAELGGLRVDTYPYNDKAAMAKWAKAITTEYPNFNIVGEAWLSEAAHISYWQKNSGIAKLDNYNSELPSVMDFPLFSAIPPALQEKENWDRGLIRLYNSFANDFLYPSPENIMVFFENHDTERFNEIFNGDSSYYKMALSLISTVRGIPQIYYGSEIGMRGKKSDGDADIRRDFPGGWPGDTQNAFTESGRTAGQRDYHDFTSRLLTWRKTAKVIHTGKTKHYLPLDNVYVYFRYDEQDRVMVILNNNDKEMDLPLARFAESINQKTFGTDVISGEKYALKTSGNLKVPARSALILELK